MALTVALAVAPDLELSDATCAACKQLSTCLAAYGFKAVWTLVVFAAMEIEVSSEEEPSSSQQVVGASLGLAGAVVAAEQSTSTWILQRTIF